MNPPFPLNAKVRFTQERLSILSPRDRKSLDGRIGVVEGYWNGTRKPTVNFSADGARVQLRLLRVDPQHLELVEESPVQPAIEPQISDESDANRKLSQSELDDLFG
ncbi:MAG: hypothetical protein IPH54_21010 [Rhodoferax sp.]|nr:hypothetical protein [Rhodoferax sp.]